MLLKGLLGIQLLLLTLGQLLSISKDGGFNIYLFDVFIFIFVGYGFVYFLVKERSLVVPRFFVIFSVFVSIAAFSLFRVISDYSIPQGVISLSYLVRLVMYYLSGLVVFNMVDKRLITMADLTLFITLSGVLLSVLGFIQLLILPDFEVLDPIYGWDPHKNRLASSFFDPNFAGAYLVICIAVILDKLYSQKVNAVANYSVFLILLAGVFLTFSRSAWLMFAIVVFIYGLFKSKNLLYVALLIAFSAYFAVPRVQTRLVGITDPADSAHFRLISWENTLEIIKANWLFGVGYNTYRFVQKDYTFLTPDNYLDNSGAGSDSSLLFIFATTGVFGIITYIGSYGYVLCDALRKNIRKKILLVSLILGLVVESQFINSLFYPQIMFLVMILLPSCLHDSQP